MVVVWLHGCMAVWLSCTVKWLNDYTAIESTMQPYNHIAIQQPSSHSAIPFIFSTTTDAAGLRSTGFRGPPKCRSLPRKSVQFIGVPAGEGRRSPLPKRPFLATRGGFGLNFRGGAL